MPTTGSGEVNCNGTNTNCQIYKIASWIIYYPAASTAPVNPFPMDFIDSGSDTFKTPDYYAALYNMRAYTIDDGTWAEDHTFADITTFVTTDTLDVTITHILNTLHRKTYDVWTFDITPTKGSLRI